MRQSPVCPQCGAMLEQSLIPEQPGWHCPKCEWSSQEGGQGGPSMGDDDSPVRALGEE